MLLLVAGTEARREANRTRLESLVSQVDWLVLAGLLGRLRVMPTVGPRILEVAGDTASPRFAEEVAACLEEVRRWDGLLMMTSGWLVEALENAGIAASVLKGPALGETLYGQPGRRISSDIDLLVPCERLEDAVKVMAGLGYGPPTDARGKDGRPLLHFAMVHDRGALPAVELHWRIHWYEDRFARERLLPPAPGEVAWRPRPTDQLAALLLYYARDGFNGLRQATDLAAWWDRFGAELPPCALEEVLDEYPGLRPAVLAAARVAARMVGLPSERILRPRGLGFRGRLALRLADPRPYPTSQQLYAEIGLIDGLLTPFGGLLAFLRRQVVPPREVIRQHVERSEDAHLISTAGYAMRVLGRYAIAIGRLLRVPGAHRVRFGASSPS
jgi:Uncharacterised nucleotidyltransferase